MRILKPIVDWITRRDLRRSLVAIHREVQRQGDRIMSVSNEVRDLAARIDAATTEVAKDLKDLRDQLAAGSMTKDEAVALLTPIAERLEAMGADPEDPVPEPPVVVDPPYDHPGEVDDVDRGVTM